MLDASQIKVRIIVHEQSADLCRLLIGTAAATGNNPHDWEFWSTDGSTVPGLRGTVRDYRAEHPGPVNMAARDILREMHENQWPTLLLDTDCAVLRPRFLEELAFQINVGGGQALLSAMYAPKLQRQEDGTYDEMAEWGWTTATGVGLYLPGCWPRLENHFKNLDMTRTFDAWMGSLLYPDMLVPATGIKQFPVANAESLDIAGENTYLHHGCKDGSLQRLVIESAQ